jgi:hypothetical protein
VIRETSLQHDLDGNVTWLEDQGRFLVGLGQECGGPSCRQDRPGGADPGKVAQGRSDSGTQKRLFG